MNIFENMVDSLFNNSGLSLSAVYTPVGGDPISVKVIRRTPAQETALFNTHSIITAYAAEVRVSEIENPQEGDLLVIDADNFIIRKTELDGEKLTWKLDLDKQ